MVSPELDDRMTIFSGGLTLDFAVRTCIFIVFPLLLVLSQTHNVNWDEFYFLSHVESYVNGRLDRPMQTFFVHGFTWLNALPGYEMERVFAARLVMVACLGLTTFAIHRIAWHLTDQCCADIAALGFLTSGFVISHGASFRADPIAAALLTSSIAILMTTRLTVWQISIAAVLSALALLVTIKSTLYLPAFLAVLIWRFEDRNALLRIVVAGCLAGVICGALYFWHATGIRIAEGNETAKNVKNALNTTLLNSGLFPRRTEILSWVMFSIPQIILVGLGVSARLRSRQAVLLALFAAPLLTVVIYRNAFVYFFPFAVPLLMVSIAFGAKRLGSSRRLAQLVLIMLVGLSIQIAQMLPDRTDNQRAAIAEVHRLFPEPVSYIDDSHMIATFPNAGFFMSSWGVLRYRATGQEVFGKIITEKKPPLLIANKFGLIQTMDPVFPNDAEPILLPEDHKILRESYVHYAGPIWLAGQAVTLTDGLSHLAVPFAGRYRLEADQPVQIDSKVVVPGAVLSVGETSLNISGPKGASVRLIWDTGVVPLTHHNLNREVYAGFRMLFL